MGLLIKAVFFCGLAAFVVSNYGDDLVNKINEAGARQNNPKEQINLPVDNVHSMQVPMQRDGHYWVDMNVNNNNVKFIVDTGATYVTLSHQDAEHLDLHLYEDDYDVPVNTAAGLTTMALVSLDVVSVGVIELYDVKAFVARENMLSVSLLGMNFLSRLDGFEFRNQQLILEQ